MADNTGNILPGSTDFEKLEYLVQRTYKAQAVWFLNAFWDTIGEREAENLWNYVHKAVEIDLDHREAGTHLNEMEAHRLLESFDETMTVREMRTYLRQHGAIGERVKNVPLVHWWIAKYKVDWAKMVNASQGDNREAIEKAQAMLESAQAALNEATARANEAATALREAIASESAAKTAELRQHGAIGERVKNVPLTHWWIAKYKADWAVLVNAPQGDNSEAIEKAQAMLESAQAALNEATARANEAANALRQAIAAEDAAKAREAEAKAAEAAAVAREDSAKSAEAAAVSREQAAKSA
eukprot:CAMPEP_0174246026 /NCGR_PEP_ID=MMETSP0417-20130205/41863_1 /TAXON_ID=242541 /ORGANISM="Mayorella sp, Strain BSH-02190019" /LENGTH=298 /DNA_ID=CAMNT_0015325877 /DNA_START=75 /DNA_END=968 /DNA_ORIENTATION=+